MLFSSNVFLYLFLPLVLVVYLLVGRHLRNAWLLLASLVFYAWGEVLFVLLMLVSITANYTFGRLLERPLERGGGRGVIVAAVVFNIGLLVLFKYADWMWDSACAVLAALGLLHGTLPRIGDALTSPDLREVFLTPEGAIRLPIGISFFTFQALSYVIDVYRRETPVQRRWSAVALYVALFPQLIAGPIVRYHDVAQQIVKRATTLPGFAEGVRRFVLGLGKKMLLANVTAKAADAIFAIPGAELTPAVAWLGIVCYALQIYFDFSGYSDMAIGLGHMVGFHFLENFKHPYVSRSVTEFWRRWHLSLSTWFRDYLYVPLGGNRKSPARTYFNLVVVFTLCGMWHGAAWNFLVWGLFHGLFLVIERAWLGRVLQRWPRVLQHAYTLLVVLVGWVFFRAEGLGRALEYLNAMLGLQVGLPSVHTLAYYVDPVLATVIVAGVVGSVPWLDAVRRWLFRPERAAWRMPCNVAGLVALACVLTLCALELSAGTYNPFIYFRF